jgi:hypothetical protein
MTSKQMLRMIRQCGISLVKGDDGNWHAGTVVWNDFRVAEFHVSTRNPVSATASHTARTPEAAVEDFCNARNIEWDRED